MINHGYDTTPIGSAPPANTELDNENTKLSAATTDVNNYNNS